MKQRIGTIDEFINEQKINEGQFSWFTQDTYQQIGSERGNKIPVYMFDNEGNSWFERNYQGYGVFGGKDFYELVATMNGYKADRDIGIDIEFNNKKSKTSKKPLFPALVKDKNFNWKKHDFTQKPKNDPDQGWEMEDETGDDDEYGQRW